MSLVGAIVRDVYDSRTKTVHASRTRLQRRMSELESKKNRLVEAFVYDKAIDEQTFEAERQRLAADTDALAERIAAERTPTVDVEKALTHATQILTDLNGSWNRLEPARRHMFATAMFPEGLSYADGDIGTAAKPWIFSVRDRIDARGSGLVAPTGFEPALPP